MVKNVKNVKNMNVASARLFFIFLHVMASFGVYVPDSSDLLERIEARAKAEHDGKVSSYARAAIERDMKGATLPGGPHSTTILVDLAKTILGPVLVDDMAAACEGVDQRRELYQLLTRFIAERSQKYPPSRVKHP
jgi:hypothetical protein